MWMSLGIQKSLLRLISAVESLHIGVGRFLVM